jgi:tRNA-specific 2-thiouridylase
MIKAISMLSGGLDSTLATKAVMEQGIEVIAVNFTSPFCLCGGKLKEGCKRKAVEMAEQLKVPLKILSVAAEFIEVVKNPKHGYGSSMNPCIDCRILKFGAAKKYMEEIGAAFIVTGEVLGQRPMSQNKTAMEIIEKESGLEGYIVRPLSANAMKPSIPEEKGWVDRSRFFDITGRSRQHQLELVDEWKITGHACPAGGCLLTDKYFGLKVKDLITAGMFNLSNAGLFMHGRYFPVSDKFKLAVARNEEEGETLKRLARKDDLVFEPAGRGPFAVGRGEAGAEGIKAALGIVSFYCKEDKPGINFSVYPDKETQLTEVQKPEEKFILGFRLA